MAGHCSRCATISYGGAIADVPDEATAFSQRAIVFEYVGSVRWNDPTEDSLRIEQARTASARLAPYAGGVYVNVLSDEGIDGIRRAYPPEELTRLSALKGQYDPNNVLHLNPNIAPPTGPPVG